MRYVCKQNYLDQVTVTKGTTADATDFGPGAVIRLTVVAPTEGSDVLPGEALNVPRADFYRLWDPAPVPPVEPSWDDDRGKQRQRHPADPEFGP